MPSAIAAGISRCGMFAARNNSRAIGAKTKNATNRLTPPYVTSAPASTTARMARRGPNLSLMNRAMALTDPLSSISLPNSAPSRKIGKNCAMNCAALPMNVCVQWASSGSPAKAAATIATAGASSNTLQPRNESQIRRPRATKIPTRPISSPRCVQTCCRRMSRSIDEHLPTLSLLAARKVSAARRPSSRSMHRKSHSALNFDDAPSPARTSLAMR